MSPVAVGAIASYGMYRRSWLVFCCGAPPRLMTITGAVASIVAFTMRRREMSTALTGSRVGS